MRLIREYRFYYGATHETKALNTWAGTSIAPPTSAFWTLRATLEGETDPQTGYLCDIKTVDDSLRIHVQPCINQFGDQHALVLANLCGKLREGLKHAADSLPANCNLTAIELRFSPFTRIHVDQRSTKMKLTQSFEFAASHRLNCANLSEAENRRLFGKCNYPHGHGHNYIFEVTVEGEPNEITGSVADLPFLDRVVRERVIEPFDHRNLNVECAEFAKLNPTVENIARVIWQRIEGGLSNCRLASIRVWETAKTCAEYAGE